MANRRLRRTTLVRRTTLAAGVLAVVHDVELVPDEVRRSAGPVLSRIPPGVPEQLVVRGMMAWTYLFGTVSFEVFGHRSEIVTDPKPFFDYEIRQVAVTFGLTGPV